jgi:hypothetical protein
VLIELVPSPKSHANVLTLEESLIFKVMDSPTHKLFLSISILATGPIILISISAVSLQPKLVALIKDVL